MSTELRGSHKSLDRYRYAKDAPAACAIYQKYMDKIDDRYGQMDEAVQAHGKGKGILSL